MTNFRKHLLKNDSSIKEALVQLNILAKDAILFVIDDFGKLQGSITDGDIRRGLIKGIKTDDLVTKIIQPNPKSIQKSNYNLKEIISLLEYYAISNKIDLLKESLLTIVNLNDLPLYTYGSSILKRELELMQEKFKHNYYLYYSFKNLIDCIYLSPKNLLISDKMNSEL